MKEKGRKGERNKDILRRSRESKARKGNDNAITCTRREEKNEPREKRKER